MIRLILVGVGVFLTSTAEAQGAREPVIDMHFHALGHADQGPPPSFVCAPFENWPIREPGKPISEYMKDFTGSPDCANRIATPTSDAELMQRNLASLERNNVLAVASGSAERVESVRRAAPKRILYGVVPSLKSSGIGDLRALHRAGRLQVIGEFAPQYNGIAPNDPRLEPYYALAEELDVPIGIHIGPGPPGAPYFMAEKYRMSLSNPLLLEDVLLKHPKMRLYVMHAGWPMGDAMVALLYAHPQVYVDTAVISFSQPRAEFHAYLKRLVEAGYGKRIMFGSDQMVWPEAIDVGIAAINEASFLSQEQKRDILYNNAARFLRLPKS